MSLELLDSDFIKGKTDSAIYMSAVDELQKQFNDSTLEIIRLQSYSPKIQVECPVWYDIKSYEQKKWNQIVNECQFFSSHYIGRFSHNGLSITVNPRFGNIFSYLISYASNLYLPLGSSEIAYNTRNNSYWLIALIWKAMLNKALTLGQIPKGYETIRKNQRSFRGRLIVNKHIQANLCDATKFYCSYKKLSMDNAINQTIRTAYALLKTRNVSSVISEFEAYDKYLESMGVKSSMFDTNEIEKIRYTRLSEPYKSVMEVSKTILSNYRAESSKGSGSRSDISYFIDIAELWELYLLRLLQNHLPSEYRVYSPNSNSGTNLLEGNLREIRPDILIEKDGRVVMIIDAKYKNYYRFGRSSEQGVQRDDLYQMSTYLYHYGSQNNAIIGIFTSPVSCPENDVYTFSENLNHRIGLVNLNIADADDDVDRVHEEEKKYIATITSLLNSLC